jgi:hypothetical protein
VLRRSVAMELIASQPEFAVAAAVVAVAVAVVVSR